MSLQHIRQLDKKLLKQHILNSFFMLKGANPQNISRNLEHLRSQISREKGVFDFTSCPDFISIFIASYLKDSRVKTILDCWAGMGEILSLLVPKFEPSIVIGINNFIGGEYGTTHSLPYDTTVDWRLGDPLLLLDEINTEFNIVIGCPPFRGPFSSLRVTLGNSIIELKDYWTNLIILKAALRLDTEGVGFFIVPPQFLKEQENESNIYNNLERFGLFIDAVLYIPLGSFAPGTQMPGLLVIIRRRKNLSLFVGELTSDLANNNTLLENLKARKTAKTPPHQGVLVELRSFRSFPKLVVEYEVERSAKDLRLSPTPISQLCTAINFTNTQTEEFSDLPNAVYLPITSRELAVYSLANLNIKDQQDYVQIVLNSEKAIAEYVASFLNTSLGHKIRELYSERTDRYMVQIRKSEVVNMDLYLPEPEIQRKIIGIKSVITNLSTELEALEKQLWNYPQKYKETQKAVNLLNHVDNFEAWVESLPFPLASILWVYHADDNAKDKVDHLFHFFEALSQFVCVVMLSSYATDPNLYNEESGAWINSDPKYKGWELTPSFGSWIHLGRNLAKATRTLKEDKTKQERLLEAFGKPESDFLKMLTDKQLFNELDEVCKYRNLWKGHGGVSNFEENQRRLTLLESSLARVRQIISDRWETSLMLRPGSCTLNDGIFEQEVSVLLGTKTTFKKKIVQTLAAMEKKKLYILHTTQQRPVALLPFIRLMESPKTQQIACYFYSRTYNEKIRWVSYYFDDEAELTCLDAEVHSALSWLRAKDESGSHRDEIEAVRAENQRLHIELSNSENEKELLQQELAKVRAKVETESADRE